MTKFDRNLNGAISYVWLAVAIAALFAVFFKGAHHQLFVAVLAIVMFIATRPKRPVHIPEQAYSDLNMQIEKAISEMEDEGTEETVVETDEGDAHVSLRVRLEAHVYHTRFMDEAWGQVRKFTETNYYCYVEILEARVTDENGNAVDSDFDESRIEAEYETTDWK